MEVGCSLTEAAAAASMLFKVVVDVGLGVVIGILTGVVGCVTKIGFLGAGGETVEDDDGDDGNDFDAVGLDIDVDAVDVVDADEDEDVMSVDEDEDAVGATVFSPSVCWFFLFWLHKSPAPGSRNHGGNGILVVVDEDFFLQAKCTSTYLCVPGQGSPNTRELTGMRQDLL